MSSFFSKPTTIHCVDLVTKVDQLPSFVIHTVVVGFGKKSKTDRYRFLFNCVRFAYCYIDFALSLKFRVLLRAVSNSFAKNDNRNCCIKNFN